ncbi:MAG: uL13 family ribosomal protein, partial [bacterium]|nr:uL13 family ribosomal protein [bacterium]
PRIIVRIKNIDKIVLTGKKTEQKVYIHHTRYAGGLRTKTYKDLIKKDPGRPLKLAVMGMLPKNRQRAKIIKNLIIEK